MRALTEEVVKDYLAASWRGWLEGEYGKRVQPSTMAEAGRFANELGLSADELRDRLAAMHPGISRELIRSATRQKDAERQYWLALSREVEAGRLDPTDAVERFQAFGAA